MKRLTSKEKIVCLSGKGKTSLEEDIYIKLGGYEDREENKDIYSKEQVNIAVKKGVNMFAGLVRDKLAEEIVLTLLSEIKAKCDGEKIGVKEIEQISKSILGELKKWQKV